MRMESFLLPNSRTAMRESAMALLPDRVGKYRVLERIDVGGMAELFKASRGGSHGFEKLVAVKKMLPHLAIDPVAMEMFLDEARITAHLEHPRIVQAIELGTDADAPYLVMEYVDGMDVLTLLRECARTQIRLPATFAALIAREVLDALDYAHGVGDSYGRPLHIVHRDVSPSNILLAWNGDIKLTDFGVALAADRRSKTNTHTLRGKYGYMSPEQVAGEQVDPRSDLFAVGIVLAEMVMARRLFTAATDLDVLLAVRDVQIDRIDEHASEFPLELLAIVLRCLQRDPRDRWQSAAELREALDTWLEASADLTARALAGFMRSVIEAPTVEIGPGSRLGRGSSSHRAVTPEIELGDDEIVLDTRDLALFDAAELELVAYDIHTIETRDLALIDPADVFDVEIVDEQVADEAVVEVIDEPATSRTSNSQLLALDEVALQRRLDQALADISIVEHAPRRFRQFTRQSQGDEMPAILIEDLPPPPVVHEDPAWASAGARLYAALGGAFGVCVTLALVAMLIVLLI
ncbi:MAG: serine/threonine-protein kinase [Kofleriaceae bacterium]